MASNAVSGIPVVPHAPPLCGFLKLTQPPPWGAGPFSQLLGQLTEQNLAITGKLVPLHGCLLHKFPHLSHKKEAFTFIFRDPPNTACMFICLRWHQALSKHQVWRRERMKTLPLLEESSRRGRRLNCCFTSDGWLYCEIFPDTVLPLSMDNRCSYGTHFEYLGGPLTCFHSGGQHGFPSVFMLIQRWRCDLSLCLVQTKFRFPQFW